MSQPFFNTATSAGRLMLNVLMSFASYERELIAERTSAKAIAGPLAQEGARLGLAGFRVLAAEGSGRARLSVSLRFTVGG